MDKKTMFLAVLSTTSIIIAGDLATQLHHTQRALEMEQQRVEVLEVQAHDLGKEANNWRRSYFVLVPLQIGVVFNISAEKHC